MYLVGLNLQNHKKGKELYCTGSLHSRLLVLICVSVSISVCETQHRKENRFSTATCHTVQWGSAARDYSVQCDRPSHLRRVVKGRGCHSAPARSHMARSTCRACYWLSSQLLTWCTMSECFRNQIPSASKNKQTGFWADEQICSELTLHECH